MIVSPLKTLNRLAAGHVLDPPASCHLGLPRPFPRVLGAPVPVDGGHHLFEPILAGEVLGERITRKMLHAITPWMTEWLEQPCPHQWRNIMRGDSHRFSHFLLGHDDGIFSKRLWI